MARRPPSPACTSRTPVRRLSGGSRKSERGLGTRTPPRFSSGRHGPEIHPCI